MSLSIHSSSTHSEPAADFSDRSEAVSDLDRRRFAALLNERERTSQQSQQNLSERQASAKERDMQTKSTSSSDSSAKDLQRLFSSPSREPSQLEGAKDRFADLMKNSQEAGRHDLESGQAGSGQKGASEDATTPMSALFSQGSMGSFLSQLEGAPQAAKPEAAPRLDPQEVQQIADRILVSAPSGGAQEVRITPNSGLLPGTEIIVTRDAAGMLQVSVKTTDETAFQTLVGAQNNLKDALQSKETMPVRVVIDSQQAGAEDNDSRRRSAGLFEQYGNEES